MNYNEVPELLLKSARLNVSSTDYRVQASAIVVELGYLALVIDQAGAYIASGEYYLDDFLDVFNEYRQYLLENKAYRGASGSDRAVYTIWDLSYAAIDRQVKAGANEALRQGPRAVLQILRVFPFFHNEGIIEDIFRFTAENSKNQAETEYKADYRFLSVLLRLRPDGRWESQSFRQGIQTLLSFSLAYNRLTVVEKEHFCHQARDILQRSIAWRFTSSDYVFRRDLLSYITTAQRRSNLPSITSQKEGIAEFALAFWEAGRGTEAEELQVQVMETRKRVLGEEHPHTLGSMNNLALIYSSQGRWTEAEKLQVQVIETRKRVLGEEHPDTLGSINNLASTYWDQGRWKEAEELGVQVVQRRKRVLGEEHPDTLGSINNLASTYRDQGRWKEAEELGVQVVQRRKRVLGEEHPSTLTSMANLASTSWNQGRWKEAEELEVQVLQIRKRVLGEEHPSTLTSMNNLAFTLKSQSRDEEATSLMNRCLKLRKQVLGPKHPDIEISLEVLHEWQDREDWSHP